jgi:deoxyribodipyrimidine photo-lyase
MSTLVWFRRDLRVHDHPALEAARAAGGVIPVFCFDDRLLGGRHASGPRTRFMLECLRDLDASLHDRGSGLILRHGPPEREIPELATATGAVAVHVTGDSGPYARRRDEEVRRALAEAGAELCEHPGLSVVDDAGAIRTQKGHPQRVFSPYHRAWLAEERREVRGAPRALSPLPRGLAKGTLPAADALGADADVPDRIEGGESQARERLRRFLADRVARYAERSDDLGQPATSRISADLRFGCLSAREVEARLPDGEGADAFRRQLAWRDFYQQILFHFPENAHHELQERYRGAIEWSDSAEHFDAWRDGRTGYPLVDAAMRQLRREGFIHNRARLVTGSFLVKHLGIDWRRGERHFMRWLIDGDEANNNGNWQWIASVGVDPQPVYRRIYSPMRHAERYDPTGAYVRRYVPELANVPDRHLAEPARMSPDEQRECGCVIGVDYPEPIVDHAEARREALDRYAV